MERLETGLERPLGYLCKAAVSYGLLLRTVERISDLEPQKTHAAQLRHVNQKLFDETNAEDRRLLHEKQKYENEFATSLRASAEELARGFELAAQRNEATALARQLKSASAATEKQVQELSMEISKLHRENKRLTESLNRMSKEFAAFKFEVREAAKADTSRAQTESLQKQVDEAQKLAEEARKESAELRKLLQGTRKNLKSRADAAYSLAEDAQTIAADAQKRAEQSQIKAEQASSKAEQSTYKAEQADTKAEKVRTECAHVHTEIHVSGDYLREQTDQLVKQTRQGLQASGVSMPALEPPPPPRASTAEVASAKESSSMAGNQTAPPPRRRRFSDDIQLLPVGFPPSKPTPATGAALSQKAAAAEERGLATGDGGESKGGGPGGFGSDNMGVAEVRDRVAKLEHDFLTWKGGAQNELLAKLFNYPKRIEQGIKAVAASVLELQEEVERLSTESLARPMPVVV